MSVDARIVRGGVIGAWALFFLLLWQTGTSDRYLGSRTQCDAMQTCRSHILTTTSQDAAPGTAGPPRRGEKLPAGFASVKRLLLPSGQQAPTRFAARSSIAASASSSATGRLPSRSLAAYLSFRT